MLEKKIKLKEQERITAVVRRYGLTFFSLWVLSAIFLIAPFFFMFWLFQQGWWGQALFVISVLAGLLLIIRTIFMWQKNVFVVTTHRLVDIEQRGFFDVIISEVPYDQVEDVSGRVKGIGGTIFRYGNLEVQTGGGKVKIIVDRIKQPHYLQQEINELRERHLARYSRDFSGDATNMIIDKLYELGLPELLRVREVLMKRMNKLNKI